MTDNALCVNPGCRFAQRQKDPHLPPRRAHHPARLCGACTEQMQHNITDAAALHVALANALTTTTTPDNDRVTGNSAAVGLNLNPAVIDARLYIATAAARWAYWLADTQHLTRPSGGAGVTPLCRWIAGQVDIIAESEQAATAAEQWHQIVRGRVDGHPASFRALAYPSGTRSFIVGPCPTTVTDPTTPDEPLPCPGQVRAFIRDADDLLPAALVCTADTSHTWAASRWLALGRQIHGETA